MKKSRAAVKHGLLVVVAAAAIVVGGLAGCSNKTSTTSSSTTTSSSARSSSAPSSAPTGSPNAGAAQFTITLNGQTIGHGSSVLCIGPQSPTTQINAGDNSTSSAVAEVAQNPLPPTGTQLVSATITQNENGKSTNWVVQRQNPNGPNSNAMGTVTKSGNTYKITGTAVQMVNPGSPVPFEIDATCP